MKYRIIIFLLLLPFLSYSQSKYVTARDYIYTDKEIVDSIYQSLRDTGIDTIIIYQTNYFINDTTYQIFTFVLFNQKNKTFVKKISCTNIYETLELKDSKIFSYKNKLKTAATEDELYDFPVSCFCGLLCDFIIFRIPDFDYYFEHYGSTVSISPDPKKEKFRKEWIGIFEKEIYSIIDTFEIESDYSRDVGCEEQDPKINKDFKYR
jgi:hypothetical protein